jgi:hypothetical protein
LSDNPLRGDPQQPASSRADLPTPPTSGFISVVPARRKAGFFLARHGLIFIES